MARTQSRPFAVIKEALLVHERVQGLGLSQKERRRGRRRKARATFIAQYPFLRWRALRNSATSTTSAHTMTIAIVAASSAFMT
jgi:hypothetical protein